MPKTRILVVDDDVGLSAAVKSALEQAGDYGVLVENDPCVAVFAAKRFRPDVILMDVIMPDKDGGTVAAELREDASLQDIPVIFLTSIVGKDEASAMGGMIGNEPVLPKPVSIDDLTKCIEEVLGRRTI